MVMSWSRSLRKKLAFADYADINDLPAEDEQPLEVEDWVLRGINTLPANQQMTVMLVFYLGLSYEETAEVTESPVNTVKTRVYSAKQQLKKTLQHHGVTEDIL